MANHVLLIGLTDYLLQAKLNCCVKDCQDLKEILVEKYSFNHENVIELYNENATNLIIQKKLIELTTLTDNDNLIIYYSGHGGFNKSTENGFWIPYDSNPNDFTTWLNNEVILSYIGKIKAKHIFLVSDSCFSRSILITGSTKSILTDAKDYDFFASRWALTSGAAECIDGSPGENSFFAEIIINYLKENTEDLRVSKLIEAVKEAHRLNRFQKPQGYPLNDSKHKGGELILKVNDDVEYSKQIKGYKDFLTILQLYRKNATFKEVDIFENKALRIGYQIYQELDEVEKKVKYYLFLYEGINQQKTHEHIRRKHPEIFREKTLIILIAQEKHQTNPEKRKNNIKDKFQPLNIFYIDDFIRQQCTPKNLNHTIAEKYLGIQNFIRPSFEYNNQVIDNDSFFPEWLKHENEPIMVIKGEGGIGKTTVAQFIADKFIKIKNEAFVLFIDSSEIITELIDREKRQGNINVYNFYEALHDSRNTEEMLNEDLFRLNLDAGNFLLIIDGLDEVISKLPKFNVDAFLYSIINYTSDIGNGKTIIACRSYFWETSKFSSNEIKTIEILPFNPLQTKKFFEESFPLEKRKIEKALKIADEFKFKDEQDNNSFHPYVLDVVRAIVDSDQEILRSDDSFTSDILEKSVKNDYIIYRICYRERLRVEQITVDEQINFFSYWAIKKRGIIRLENFANELKESLKKHIDNNTIEAFKSHPFIQVIDRTIQFKYDFFADYFKSIYLSRHLQIDGPYDKISEDFLKIVNEDCWYGSSIISDIKNRVMNWSENEILKCSDIIDQILIFGSDKSNYIRKSLSGFFNVCLATNIKFKSNNIEQNTLLIRELFGKNNSEICGLHIINMHSNDETIRFDFKDLILKDCFIDNYQAFWNCSFNDSTFFINSYLLNLEFDLDKKIPIPKQNFQNCTTDLKFSSAFKKDDSKTHNLGEQIRDFLHEFFNLFYSRGILHPQTINKPHKGREHHPPLNKRYLNLANNIFEFDIILDLMKKENIIEVYSDYAEEKVKITNDQKTDILKFIKDGTVSTKINGIIKKLHSLVNA